MAEPALAERPDLAQRSVRDALPCRVHPYWALLEFSRHVGYQKRAGQPTFWMARFRTEAGK